MEKEEETPSVESPLLLLNSEENLVVGFKKSVNRAKIVTELKKQLWLAGPLISVNLLLYSSQVISVMFIGHLGKLALSGSSMASSFVSVTGFSLLGGIGSALDTLCGQSYGAKQYHMLGIHMQRAMFVLLLVSIPLAVICFNTGHILTILGQDPVIAAEAGQYARFLIPSIFAYAILQCQKKFLQTQNNVSPMMIIATITTVFDVFICWILVIKSDFGNKGAALAKATSYWINVLLLSLYINFSPACKQTWSGFSREALHDVLHFLRLGVPSALMVCLEAWSFELMVLLSGFLPNPRLETSVLSISLNTCALVFMIPFGLSGALSTRVSNELGAGRPQAAQLAVWVAVAMFLILGVLVASTMILVRQEWGKFYSNDEKVVSYVAKMMPLIAASYLLDGVQSLLSGTIRGCGRQKIGAKANFVAYYLVGIPSAIVFAFVFHIGGKGLWLGIMCGLFAQSLSLLIVTLRTNWDQEAKKAS